MQQKGYERALGFTEYREYRAIAQAAAFWSNVISGEQL